jgi:hypothetical protein
MQPATTINLTTTSGFKVRNPEIDVSVWDDATLSGFISRATRAMQNYCNVDGFMARTISGETAKAVISVQGDLVIYPRVRPLTASGIQSISLVKGGFSTTLTLSGANSTYFQVPYPYTSLVYPSSYLTGTGTIGFAGSSQFISLQSAGTFYVINYTAGYTTAPEDLQDACDLYVRDYCLRRLNPLGMQEMRQGSVQMSRTIRSSALNADLINNIYVQQAREILNNGGYVRTAMG